MSAAPHILVADDDRSIRLLLETGLSLHGFEVTAVRSGRQAIEQASQRNFDAVLSDVYMPDGSGLDVVGELRSVAPAVPVVLMTAQASVEAAVEAVSLGATNFIGKPFEVAEVAALLRRLLAARREAAGRQGSEISDDAGTTGLVGRSAPMVLVYKLMAQAARTEATVLITGESGTGKELVAKGIHRFSSRSSRPFLSVNCSGLTDTLLESELFGYVRGSFTGASGDRAGLFEAADGGTLFLDELASTSPAFQASLLRVLQTGEVRRVGSTQMRRVNVRVIAASNAALRELVDMGRFRADLYYRLSVISLDLPPLRQRTGDVSLLTSHFLREFAGDGPAPYLTREAAEALSAHHYPGNVRELENALRRACALAANGLITLDCLPPEIASAGENGSFGAPSAEQRLVSDRPGMDELQKRYLELILAETGWNRRRAAAVLQLDRRTVQRLIARYKLQGAEDPEGEADEEAA
jgi:two-component system, NtrC family, response regulator AtoC